MIEVTSYFGYRSWGEMIMRDASILRFRFDWLFASAAMLAATPAGAQLYTTPAQPVDQVHSVTSNGLFGHSSAARVDDEDAMARLTAFGECVVSRDAAGSAAYIRASVAPGNEASAYRALRIARRCEALSGADHFLLDQSSVRQSAIADALRARLKR